MSYEIPSQQPDMLLDYYERHLLRTIGDIACTRQMFNEPESQTERALKLYESSPENVDITNSFIDAPTVTPSDRLALLAFRAKVWGDDASRKIAVGSILNMADSREEKDGVTNKDIIDALVVAGRPDIAREKLESYRGDLGNRERELLLQIGKGYCKTAKSKKDLKVVSGIIDELEMGDTSTTRVVITRWGIFKKTRTYIDKTKPRPHKDLQDYLNGAKYRLEHPEFFEYSTAVRDEDPYPYATAYREGGLSAAFGLHEYRNRASKDKSAHWSYRSIVGDLAQSGELALAHKLAEEGIAKVAQEYEGGAVPAHTHYDIVHQVIDGYARAHDLERAHVLTTAIPGFDKRDVQVTARRMAAQEYIRGYADELQPGDTIADSRLDIAIEYIKQCVPGEGERNATFEWLMDVLAPYGQVDAIRHIAAQLPPMRSTPYQYGRWPLFAAHLVVKDYEACVEYLEHWPNERLAVDALTSVVQEKQRRRAALEVA